eukprot:9499615-Pyramimonas_sp.AAC.1
MPPIPFSEEAYAQACHACLTSVTEFGLAVTCCRLPHEERWGFDLNCSSYHILMHPLKSQVIPSMQPAFSSSLRVDSQLSGKKRQPVGW